MTTEQTDQTRPVQQTITSTTERDTAPSDRFELEALVAELVMGLTVTWPDEDDPILGPMLVIDGMTDFSVEYDVPRYSRDMAAAWQVVEKIRDTTKDDETFLNLVDCGGLGWRCTIEYNLTNNDAAVLLGEATADTAPLAICLAALAMRENA